MARTAYTQKDRPVPGVVETALTMARDLIRDLSDPYRPERHYMRGPGPKWHRKHAGRTILQAA